MVKKDPNEKFNQKVQFSLQTQSNVNELKNQWINPFTLSHADMTKLLAAYTCLHCGTCPKMMALCACPDISKTLKELVPETYWCPWRYAVAAVAAAWHHFLHQTDADWWNCEPDMEGVGCRLISENNVVFKQINHKTGLNNNYQACFNILIYDKGWCYL